MAISSDQERPVLVAALGASAGGLEALQEFFDHVPKDTGVAFIVGQHLDPSRDSIGPELLGHHTEMPVKQAVEGDVLQPDHVYVTPPDAWISMESGQLHMERPGDEGTPTLVDRLFRSLAEDQGRRAVAILLSGAGSDGAAGIGRVREAGGLTMVQDPATAKFDSMPRHGISAGRVSDVLPPAELAVRLAEYTERVGREGERDELDAYDDPEVVFERVTDLLERETDRDFSRYKPPTLLRRLDRRIQMSRCGGVEEYLELLRKDAGEVQALYEDALIGVTGFFRDPDTFRLIEEDIMPRIVSGRQAGEELRFWVAGCGTGQEAYSLAMLLHRATEDLSQRPSLKIFATDVNVDALGVARRGSYPHGIAEEVPGPLLDRYFRHEQNALQVTDQIREMCIFAPHDLLTDPPFSDLDLLSCRNLLIYLKAEEQDRLMPYFHYALRPGGFLFLGASETVAEHDNLFREIEKGHRVYQRRETAGEVPMRFPGRGGRAFGGLEAPVQRRQAVSGDAASGDLGRRRFGGGYVDSLERTLLAEFTPPSVIVDDRGEIVYYHGRTGEYLEPAPGRPRDDLIDMARPGLRHELRSAMTEATESDAPGDTVRRTGVVVDTGDGWTEIDLTVRRVVRGPEDEDYFLVVFEEAAGRLAFDGVSSRDAVLQVEGHEEADRDRIIRELEEELADTRDQLQATIRELESANEELRVANEELITMNEELQSSNEELQTAQEETQSINEELQTVNAELSQKIEQLKQAHSDLENLFRSTEIATIFLDSELRFQRFTPAATDLFRLRDGDIGRPLEDITSRIEGDGERLRSDAMQVLETLETVEREIRVPGEVEEEDAWYSMRIFPYRTVDDVIDGVVLTFVDVTDIKRLELERGRLGAIVEGMHDAVVGHDLDGKITSWNEGAERLFGWDREEALGRDVRLIVPGDRKAEFASAVDRVLRGEWTSPADTRRRTREGEEIHVSVNFSPVRDVAGNVIEISQTARDISDRVEAERAVRAADRRKNEFLTMLGHELRNPLSTIQTSVELLKQGPGRPEKAGDVDPVEILDRQAAYLSDLVDDLSDMARMNTGEFDLRLVEVDLQVLVRECVEDYQGAAAAAGVELQADVPEHPVVLTGDRTRLAQVLGNLIRNACMYTPEGGSVEVGLVVEDEKAVVTVEDEGVGLSAEDLERVFDMFKRGKRPGSGSPEDGGLGLGLPVARRIVELHGGTLEAASEGPGRGSTFSFRLPLSDDRIESAADDRVPGAPTAIDGDDAELEEAPTSRRVLIVEDNRDAGQVLRQLLTSMGHDVSLTHDARSGLDAARERPPEVILCDINLPGEMDGYGLAAAVREEPELDGVRLVALTGFGREVDRNRAREAGFDEHLTKPVEAEELRRVLQG